ASFFCRSDVEALLPVTRALAFVPVERSLRPRVGLFAPLSDKVTSSAQSLIPVSVASQGSSLSILTEPHDKLAAHSITPSAAIRGTKRYGKSFRFSAETSSLRLDVGGPDHLAPFLGFLGDELAKVCGRDDKRRHTQNGEPRFYLGIGEARVDLLVELVDDVRRRVLGYADAIPVARLIARHELTHGRDVRQRVRAGRGRHRQRTPPAVLGVLDGRGPERTSVDVSKVPVGGHQRPRFAER